MLAVELAEIIEREIDLESETLTFYTDGNIVLSYMHSVPKVLHVCKEQSETHQVDLTTGTMAIHSQQTTQHNPSRHLIWLNQPG